MNVPQKSVRFAAFLVNLKAARAATSRNDAVDLMRETMKSVEDSYHLPSNNFDQRMNVFSLESSLGWMNLDADPCYWDDSQSKTHRTQVYNSGRIVITRIVKPLNVVLDKAGK